MSGDGGRAKRYLTIAGAAEAELEVKRSRFLCEVARVADEAAAPAAVQRARREHWDARHHCSAFVLGPDGSVQRSNDDGEPSGTAGAPMLEALRAAGVSDVVAVVTRWFGGVLLGTGGLVRAYGDAVRAALAEAGTLTRDRQVEYAVELAYDEAARVESELRVRGIGVLGVEYAETARLRVGVAALEGEGFERLLATLTSGRGVARRLGERWVDRPV